MNRIHSRNPLLWLCLLLLAWAVLGVQLAAPKVASGPFYASTEHHLGVTRWEAAPRLGLDAWTTNFASGDTVGAKATAVPKGFSSADDFTRFGAGTRDGLTRAGYGNVEPILQGNAVTGQSFRTGQAFDVGRVSDFDIALAGPELLQRAQSLGIGLRSGGTRTGPLSARDLQALGLKDLASQLIARAGREVNFMIYDSAATAAGRAPSVALPK